MSANANACERIGVLMAEWISGELDVESSAEVRTHLATCDSCRMEEAEMRGVIALLESDATASSGVRDPGDAY
jgi:anti-sigma factor RsiW